MKTNRQYDDIIDLEYFCHRDAAVDRSELHRRDRNIMLENREQPAGGDQPTNRQLVRLWLSARRGSSFPGPDRKSPGSIFGDTYLLARNLAGIKGILVGLLAGFSFFTYAGTTPVNVFHFLLLFVVPQLVLVGLLLAAWLLRPLLPGLKLPSFYSLLLRGMLTRIAAFIHKRWLHKMAADQRVSVSHAFGIFKARSSVYGSLFYWPLFALFQLFAIGFNLGLLAMILIKISTSDLAFGWQSTLQFSAEALHRAVALAALPWSWFVTQGSSYPSLAQIEGSRIILKEGIYHLTTGNLIAWWPFLVFCLLFYGLFLRLALFVTGKIMEHRSLQKLSFDTPACIALFRRMQTPLLSTRGTPEQEKIMAAEQAGPQVPEHPPATSSLSPQVVLIPEDIQSLCPVEELEPLLRSQGMSIKKIQCFMISYEEDHRLLRLLAEMRWDPGEGIFLLMEGWMVPLIGFLSFLKELRKTLPDRTIINIGLIGRPGATAFSQVSAEDLALWQQKVGALGDPYLTLSPLLPRSSL